MALPGRRHDRDRHRHVAAARPGPDGESDVRAAKLSGAPRVSDEVVGHCLVGRIGGAWRRRVRRTRARSRARSRRGRRGRSIRRSAAMTRHRTTPRCSHRCRSRRPRASSRAQRSGPRSRRSRSSHQSPRRSSPSFSSTTPRRRFDELLGRASPRPRRPRSGRRRPPPGRTSRRSDWWPGASPRRAAPRPVTRRSRPAGRSGWPTGAPRPIAWSRGTASSAHIGRISRGGPGSATMTRPSGRPTNQPGAVPFGLGSDTADPISHACLRLSSGKGMSRRRHSSRSHASRSGSRFGRLIADGGDRLAGQVVRRRTEAAGRDDQVRRARAPPRRHR